MTRFLTFFIVGAFVCLWGCEDSVDSDTQIAQEVLFEMQYVNFAWGYTHNGFYIDNQGMVYSYDFQNSGEIWQGHEDGYYTGPELLEKYNHMKTHFLTVEMGDLLEKYRLIEPASKGTYSDTLRTGADMGRRSYLCYLYDPRADKYQEIVLRVRGDWSYDNLEESAIVLADWLEVIPDK